MNDGKRIDRKLKDKTEVAVAVKTRCKEMKWLDKHQSKLCHHFPEMIPVIELGVQHALKECRRQFRTYRWNCSPLRWEEVFSDGGILKKRKTAFTFKHKL